MAADQRKRRFSSASTLGYGLQQGQYRAKKRDFNNFSSHILLKWDDNGKRVVAKDEQVGISWRHLSPFVASPAPPCSANSKLADVVCVPREIFELDDLTHVLSYEVWQSLFDEKERNHLSQFLPQEIEHDEVVQALFSGDNFHFGNPFQRWGASLCSGDVHPDSIIRHEKSLKAIKNENYFELQKYHDNMITNLQKLKERCTSSKDPDAEILQMMSRSRRYAEKTSSLDANGYKSHWPEENVLAISESPSTADDKSNYLDHQKLSAIRDLEIHRRIHSEEVVKDRHEKLVTCAEGVKISPKPKKGEKMQKVNGNPNDGAKYMSYVKISKKQHELVKSMKHSGSSIQSKTLNRVLGNLDSFNVKPYEMFVEEEQKRIHEFWLTLANKDIPAALHKYRIMLSQKRQIMVSLLHEMEEKQNLVKGDKVDENMANSHDDEAAEDPLHTDEESSQEASERQQNSIVREGSVSDDDKKSNPSFIQNQSPLPSSPFGVNAEFGSSSLENQRSLVKASLKVTEESDTSPAHNKSSRSTSPPLNVNKEINPMDLNAETDNVTFETSDSEMPCSPAKNVWDSIGLPESYRGIPTALYASSSEPSVRHPLVFPSQPDVLIDLESDMSEADATKDLLNKHPNHLPFFNHYPNRDRCELLQSLIKNDKHQYEKKKTGLESNPAPDVTLHPRLFPGHVYRMDNRRQSESQHLYINPNIHDSLYPDNRYPVQNPSDWSSARIPTPVQTPQFSSGELLNHSWFGSENRTSFTPHSNLGSGGGEDQSLFSVLSQCNTMRSQAPYNHPVGSTDMLIPSTNYVQDVVGGMSTTTSSVLPQTGSPFDYLGETEAAATLQSTNLSWMSLGQQQQQNTDLHDPSGEPY